MPNDRRTWHPGGTFFFTLVTYHRSPILTTDLGRHFLRQALVASRCKQPFSIDAVVLLPDHLHCIWTLPPGDGDFGSRWKWIKRRFTLAWLAHGGAEKAVTRGQAAERNRGVWQPRYWEHCIRDEDDLRMHVDYIHYNPVKHGLVTHPGGWTWSSFHRYVRQGTYPADWCTAGTARDQGPHDFQAIEGRVGE